MCLKERERKKERKNDALPSPCRSNELSVQSDLERSRTAPARHIPALWREFQTGLGFPAQSVPQPHVPLSSRPCGSSNLQRAKLPNAALGCVAALRVSRSDNSRGHCALASLPVPSGSSRVGRPGRGPLYFDAPPLAGSQDFRIVPVWSISNKPLRWASASNKRGSAWRRTRSAGLSRKWREGSVGGGEGLTAGGTGIRG